MFKQQQKIQKCVLTFMGYSDARNSVSSGSVYMVF